MKRQQRRVRCFSLSCHGLLPLQRFAVCDQWSHPLFFVLWHLFNAVRRVRFLITALVPSSPSFFPLHIHHSQNSFSVYVSGAKSPHRPVCYLFARPLRQALPSRHVLLRARIVGFSRQLRTVPSSLVLSNLKSFLLEISIILHLNKMPGSSSRHNAPSPIGTRAQPVIIDYDDEDEDVPQHPFSCTTRQVTDIWRRVRKEPAILDLIYDENDASLDEQTSLQTEEAEARYERELEIIDLTEDQDVERPGPRRGSKLVSHAFLSATHDAVRAYRISGTKYKPGDCIELTNPIGLWTIQFVEIKSIWVQSSTGDVIFRGLPYSRALRLNGRLECKRNEVCQILIVNADDDRPDQAQLDIKPEQILCLRSLKKTNAAYPTFRYAGDSSWLSKPKTTQETLGPLTCRWKMLAQYRGRKLWRYDEGMVRLMEDDVEDSKFRVSDRESLKAWRDTDKIGPISPDGQKYTFCDIFSGCGGVTRGASMAGLKVKSQNFSQSPVQLVAM